MEQKLSFSLEFNHDRVSRFFVEQTSRQPSEAYRRYVQLSIAVAHDTTIVLRRTLILPEDVPGVDISDDPDILLGGLFAQTKEVLSRLAILSAQLQGGVFGGPQPNPTMTNDYCDCLIQLIDIYNQVFEYSNDSRLEAFKRSDARVYSDTLGQFLAHTQTLFVGDTANLANDTSQHPPETSVPYAAIGLAMLGISTIVTLSVVLTMVRAEFKPGLVDYISLGFLALSVLYWRTTLRVFQRWPIEMIYHMFKLGLTTRQLPIFSIGLLMTGVGTLETFFPGALSPVPPLLQLSLSTLAISYVCLPPALLMLGSSEAEAAPLYMDIVLAASPLKVVHLIDDARFSRLLYQNLTRSNYRTIDDDAWRRVVRQFMQMVPFIVIDTRIDNRAVVEETEWLLSSPNLLKKTLFVTDSAGKGLILERVAAHRDGSLPDLNCTTPEQIRAVIMTVKKMM